MRCIEIKNEQYLTLNLRKDIDVLKYISLRFPQNRKETQQRCNGRK